MKARDFDEKFDSGADVSGDVDWGKARRPNLTLRRVNVDFPAWVVEALDREARRLGVTRQALVKLWIAERLERVAQQADTPAGEAFRLLTPFGRPPGRDTCVRRRGGRRRRDGGLPGTPNLSRPAGVGERVVAAFLLAREARDRRARSPIA